MAIKLVTEDADGDDDGVEGAQTLWRAVRIVAIADIVMSLDNVIAIAATAEIAAAQVDLAHAASIKTTLIIFGLATSVPLIVAGSAILMALLERYRVLVWGGGALLGWVAGDVMVTDPALAGWFSEPCCTAAHLGRSGRRADRPRLGYIIVGRHRRLMLDEILAGVALVIWIIVDRVSDSMFGGANPDLVKIWGVRGVLLVVMIVAYAIAAAHGTSSSKRSDRRPARLRIRRLETRRPLGYARRAP